MLLQNIFRHFLTVTRHRHAVIKHCYKVGILKRGLLHDLSKYSPSEFLKGVMHFQGNRSPNERERELNGHSLAWMHHKGRNKHHFEYWTDYNPTTKRVEPVEMPKIYLVEMFCDRVAASKIYAGKNYTDAMPYDYFARGKERRVIHKSTSDELEKLLVMLKNEGETKTFKYIKDYLKQK